MDMDANRTNSITVQGRDTPVPVVTEGGQAGSPRPSSNDCGSRKVGNRAFRSKTTGTEEYGIDPFKTRASLVRTPPKTAKNNIKASEETTAGTGPARSLASDSGSPAIGNQDEGRTMDTGTEENDATIDTKRSDGDDMGAKPRTHGRANILSQLRRSNSLTGDGCRKRKIADTSITEPEQSAIKKVEDPLARDIIEVIETKAKVAEFPNTQREIKEIAAKLKKEMKTLNKDNTKEWFEAHKWQKKETLKYEVDT